MRRTGETQAVTATQGTLSLDGGAGGARAGLTTGRPCRGQREESRKWNNLLVVSYNVESMGSEDRTKEIVLAMEKKGVDIALLMGTRSQYGGDAKMGCYRGFYQEAGTMGHDKWAGTLVMIKNELLKRVVVRKMHWINSRAMAIRLKGSFIDITVVVAYAPGMHLPDKEKDKFWKILGCNIRALPRRTGVIFGIDANGHIGRDAGQAVGNAGATKWNGNGMELVKVVEEGKLVLLNTRESCNDPGWTWQRRDTQAKTKIDYVGVSRHMEGDVIENVGAMQWEEIHKQGCPLDHRAVGIRIRIRTVAERGLGNNGMGYHAAKEMRQAHPVLTRAYKAYAESVENEYRKEPKEVSKEDIDLIGMVQGIFRDHLEKGWDNNGTVDQRVEALQSAAEASYQALEEMAPKIRSRQKKEYIGEDLKAKIDAKAAAWKTVKEVGRRTLGTDWEIQMKVPGARPIGGELTQVWEHWDNLRREVRQQVRKEKMEWQEKLIEEIGTTQGEEDIFKAVKRLAPKEWKKRLALRKEGGGWCHTVEEELEEVRKYSTEYLKQVSEAQEEGGVAEEGEEDGEDEQIEQGEGSSDEDEPTIQEVKLSFRTTPPNKATPGWSVPTKLWVINEDETAEKWQQIWSDIGKDQSYPKRWEEQKVVWLEKPGKDPQYQKNLRGVLLQDGAAKAYLTWLQSRYRRRMKGKWGKHAFGAIPGRGTQQALVRVLATRERMRLEKRSSVLYLGDNIKAFDRIKRSKVLRQIGKKLGRGKLYKRIKERYKSTKAVTEKEGQRLVMNMVQGVPQGDPNGPPHYGTGYEGVLEEVDVARSEEGWEKLTFSFVAEVGEERGQVLQEEEERTMFVDDQLEMAAHVGHNTREAVENTVKRMVKPIFKAQESWEVEVGWDKTQVIIDLYGRHAQKVLRAIGGVIDLGDGISIKVTKKAGYLGTKIGGHLDAIQEDIGDKIRKADGVMARLGNVWRHRTLAVCRKVMLYKALVRTVMLYSMECRVLPKSQLQRLEAAQTRHIRRIIKEPAHVNRLSNEGVREKAGIESVQSWLQKLRLGLLRKMVREPNQAVWAAIFGWIGQGLPDGRVKKTERIDLIRDDLTELIRRLDMEWEGVGWRERGGSRVKISQAVWELVAKTSKKGINKVLRYDTEVEGRRRARQGPDREPTHVCVEAGCGKAFPSFAQLQTHRMGAHNYRVEARRLVSGSTCLICKKQYADQRGAQLQVQRVCLRRATEAQLEEAIEARMRVDEEEQG